MKILFQLNRGSMKYFFYTLNWTHQRKRTIDLKASYRMYQKPFGEP